MRTYLLAGLLSLTVCISLFALLYPPVAVHVHHFYRRLSSLDQWGYCALTLLQAGLVVVTVPVMLPNVALGGLYPWFPAFAISMVGFSLGIVIIYGLFGWFKWEPSELLRPLHRSFQVHPLKSTLLVRLLPVPMGLKNYGLASCPVAFHVYFLCGCLEGLFVNGLELTLAKEFWRINNLKGILLFVGTAGLGVTSMVLLAYYARRALRNMRVEVGEQDHLVTS